MHVLELACEESYTRHEAHESTCFFGRSLRVAIGGSWRELAGVG